MLLEILSSLLFFNIDVVYFLNASLAKKANLSTRYDTLGCL